MTGPALFVKGLGFQEGYTAIAGPQSTPLRWMTLGRLGLVEGRPHEATTGAEEVVLDVLRGAVTLEVAGQRFERLGGRDDPFADGPTLICLPPETTYRLTGSGSLADVLLVAAPAEPGEALTIVRPEDAPAREVGAHNWARRVWPGTAVAPGTRRLMVGETINPPGNWSSYPPHKHDTHDPPREAVYEEVYFFQITPPGGFGIQRLYERPTAPDALDAVYVVEDGDAVVIPRGYHPVVAAPGYQLGYVWALCGEGRVYGAWSDDPAHAWVRQVEPILRAR